MDRDHYFVTGERQNWYTDAWGARAHDLKIAIIQEYISDSQAINKYSSNVLLLWKASHWDCHLSQSMCNIFNSIAHAYIKL